MMSAIMSDAERYGQVARGSRPGPLHLADAFPRVKEITGHQGNVGSAAQGVLEIPAEAPIHLEGNHPRGRGRQQSRHRSQSRPDLPDRLPCLRREDFDQPLPGSPIHEEVLSPSLLQGEPPCLQQCSNVRGRIGIHRLPRFTGRTVAANAAASAVPATSQGTKDGSKISPGMRERACAENRMAS